jgi:CPA1 family monovalent cation:H+ antiporter
VGASGVVALVAVGFVFGRAGPVVMSPRTRTQATSVWQIVVFVLNGLIFILIGLHLPVVLDALAEYSFSTLLFYAGVISLTVVGVRLLWMPFGAYFPLFIIKAVKGRLSQPYPKWQNVAVTGWAGMRGMVSLAAALAIPITAGSEPFPARDLIIFLTFSVILVTLVGQGMTLPLLVRVLKVKDDDTAYWEDRKARRAAAEAAVRRLDELAGEQWVNEESLTDLRGHYYERSKLYSDGLDGSKKKQIENVVSSHIRMRQELLEAERHAIIRMRNEGTINDEVLHDIERDLDLEAQSLRSY